MWWFCLNWYMTNVNLLINEIFFTLCACNPCVKTGRYMVKEEMQCLRRIDQRKNLLTSMKSCATIYANACSDAFQW